MAGADGVVVEVVLLGTLRAEAGMENRCLCTTRHGQVADEQRRSESGLLYLDESIGSTPGSACSVGASMLDAFQQSFRKAT